jgi:hypothetical protein
VIKAIENMRILASPFVRSSQHCNALLPRL